MFQPPLGKPWLLYVILGSSLALNLVMVLDRPSAPAADVPAMTAAAAPAVDAALAPAAPTDAAAAVAATPAVDAGLALATEGWTVTRGALDQSLARTFQGQVGEAGDALSSVYARLYVWDLDLRRDLQRDDAVAVAWRAGPDGVPEIAAASLTSRKLNQTLTAYRWQAPGDVHASYWRPDGTEVPLRLKDSPLRDYEQITSLLKDRPTHKGMDFKTPTGTEVVSPRAGVVTRVNWNWAANGNCVEVQFDDGVLAKFLHLSENRVEPGARVGKGAVLALTGNTGRSTAPHLHYQLDQGSRVLDPLDYHGTERRALDANTIATMQRDVAAFDQLLSGVASR